MTVDPKGTPNGSTFWLGFEGPTGGHAHLPAHRAPQTQNQQIITTTSTFHQQSKDNDLLRYGQFYAFLEVFGHKFRILKDIKLISLKMRYSC